MRILDCINSNRVGVFMAILAAFIGVQSMGQTIQLQRQPESVDSFIGGTARFHVQATGQGNLRYRWRKDGREMFDGSRVEGVETSHLTISEVGQSDAGYYSVLVSDDSSGVTTWAAPLGVTLVAAWGRDGERDTVRFVPEGISNVVEIDCHGYGSSALFLLADGTVVDGGSGPLPHVKDVVAIARGQDRSMALHADGTVVEWSQSSIYDWWKPQLPDRLSDILAISAYSLHYLVLRKDGEVVAWGENAYGETNVPQGLTNVVGIAVGLDHSLALRADGTVVAWGSGELGQTNVPDDLTNAVAIAAGAYHSLALLADGRVAAWGAKEWGATEVPQDLTNVIAVAADGHSLALRSDGSVRAWGEECCGGTTVPSGLTNVVSIKAGGGLSMALIGNGSPFITTPLTDRTVTVGGIVYFRSSASGSTPMRYQWRRNGIEIPGATNAILTISGVQPDQKGLYSVVVANSHGTAISREASLSLAPASIVRQPLSRISRFVGESVSFSAEVKSFIPVTLQWWRDGKPIPSATNELLRLDGLSVGDSGSYSLQVRNSVGTIASLPSQLTVSMLAELGPNGLQQVDFADNLGEVVGLAAGSEHFLAFRANGQVVAWGGNEFGQATVPEGLSNVVGVAANGTRSLALASTGEVIEWGAYEPGLFAAGAPQNLSNIVAIAAGRRHNVALKSNGTVETWGANDRVAVVREGLRNVVAIAAGDRQTLALQADGKVVGWGFSRPNDEDFCASLRSVVAIAAGADHNLALLDDGKVIAWGSYSGSESTIPHSLRDVVAISAGGHRSLALQSDGTLVEWGDQAQGGTTITNFGRVTRIASGENHHLVLLGDGRPWVEPSSANRMGIMGGSVYFRVNPTGEGPLSYQWQKDGADLLGATNRTLQLNLLERLGASSVSLRISNNHGSTLHGPVNLSVVPALVEVLPLMSETFPLGTSVELVSSAQSTVPVVYQWYHDGFELPFATNASLRLPHLTWADRGSYTVSVRNSFGTSDSRAVDLPIVNVMVQEFANSPGLPSIPRDLTNAVAVAAGERFSLALRADGTLGAWGAGNVNEKVILVPKSATNVTAIAAGDHHALALLGTGQVVAWGADERGQATVPLDLTNVLAIAAEGTRSLALKADGSVVAWGDGYPQGGFVGPGFTNVTSIAIGGPNALGLNALGYVLKSRAVWSGEMDPEIKTSS